MLRVRGHGSLRPGAEPPGLGPRDASAAWPGAAGENPQVASMIRDQEPGTHLQNIEDVPASVRVTETADTANVVPVETLLLL